MQAQPNYVSKQMGGPRSDPNGASTEEKEAVARELRRLGQEVCEEYREKDIYGERMWIEFIRTFRPHSIMDWGRSMMNSCIELLMRRDVYSLCNLRVNKAEAFI